MVNVKNVIKNSEKICKFYKSGNCQDGKTGKKPDHNGKTCDFNHPPTCRKFELFGYKEKGCKVRDCSKLHLSLCKNFMRYQNCKFGEKCRYFHSRGLKNVSNKKEKHSDQKIVEEIHMQMLRKNLYNHKYNQMILF